MRLGGARAAQRRRPSSVSNRASSSLPGRGRRRRTQTARNRACRSRATSNNGRSIRIDRSPKSSTSRSRSTASAGVTPYCGSGRRHRARSGRHHASARPVAVSRSTASRVGLGRLATNDRDRDGGVEDDRQLAHDVSPRSCASRSSRSIRTAVAASGASGTRSRIRSPNAASRSNAASMRLSRSSASSSRRLPSSTEGHRHGQVVAVDDGSAAGRGSSRIRPRDRLRSSGVIVLIGSHRRACEAITRAGEPSIRPRRPRSAVRPGRQTHDRLADSSLGVPPDRRAHCAGVFEGYARVFHPAWAAPDVPVRWETVATWAGRQMHSLAQWDFLSRPRGEPSAPASSKECRTNGCHAATATAVRPDHRPHEHLGPVLRRRSERATGSHLAGVVDVVEHAARSRRSTFARVPSASHWRGLAPTKAGVISRAAQHLLAGRSSVAGRF